MVMAIIFIDRITFIKKKVEEELGEITCDVCGHTLKSYKNSKHKKVCEECFSSMTELS